MTITEGLWIGFGLLGAPTTSKTTAKTGRKGQEGLEEAIRQSLEALQERMAHENQDPQKMFPCLNRLWTSWMLTQNWLKKNGYFCGRIVSATFCWLVGVAIVAPTRLLGKIWKNLSAFQVFQSFS